MPDGDPEADARQLYREGMLSDDVPNDDSLRDDALCLITRHLSTYFLISSFHIYLGAYERYVAAV